MKNKIISLIGACLFTLPAFAISLTDTRPVLVVVGMADEVDIVKGDGILTMISAGSGKQLRSQLSQFDFSKVRAVISFGIGGALSPDLRVGDLAVAAKIVSDNQAWIPTPAVVAALAHQLAVYKLPLRSKVFYGRDQADQEDKAKTRQRTGADLIDTESHLVAEFATAHGLPFGALRAVSDDSATVLPPAALIPLLPNGQPDTSAVLDSILRDPAQVPQLIKLAFTTQSAYASLKYARHILDANDFSGEVLPNRPASCLGLQDEVTRLGAVVINLGNGLYDRFVSGSAYCDSGTTPMPAFIHKCFVGYTCQAN